MARTVASDTSRVFIPRKAIGDRTLYPSPKRSRKLWRTSARRRSAAEADGSFDVTAVPICGRCTAISKSTNNRCARRTCLDYRFCMQHLQSTAKLAIAPSRRLRDIHVPGNALGLYAAHPNFRLAKDRKKYPILHQEHADTVFRKGEVVSVYGGEVLTRAQFDDRYLDPNDMDTAAYGLSMSRGSDVVDGLAAAGAASYSNDPVNIAALMSRARDRAHFRQLYDENASSAEIRALINVRTRQRDKAMELVATKPIPHGSEILWTYSNGYWDTDSMKRLITGKGW